MALNDKLLRNLKAREARYEVADAGGLSVRVTATGTITFQYRFRVEGKQHRMDFGNYPDLSLADARELHRTARNKLALGTNPIEEKRVLEVTERRSLTVAELVEDFMKKEIRVTRKRPLYAEEILNNNVVSVLGKKKAKDVSRRDIVEMLEAVVARGSPVMANRTGSITKQMFSFAQTRGYLESNPCSNITRTSIGGQEKPKEYFLTYQEIWKFWHGIEKANFSESLKIALKILLTTGQRRCEIIYGEWAQIDFVKERWIIPASLSKNGKEHVVHLAPMAIELFKLLKSYSSDSKYLVPSPVLEDDVPISERAINRAVARNRDELGLKELSPHVLRHTFSTKLSGLGVAPHVIEKLLNHQLGGMFAVYNHHPYYAERKAALLLWSSKLEEILSAKSLDTVIEEPDLFDDSPS